MNRKNFQASHCLVGMLFLMAGCGIAGCGSTESDPVQSEGASNEAAATGSSPVSVAQPAAGTEGRAEPIDHDWVAVPAGIRSLSERSPANGFLFSDQGVVKIQFPDGSGKTDVVLDHPLDNDFLITVRLRWPHWETAKRIPYVRFGLRSESGEMQKFPRTILFVRDRREFYECKIRCSADAVGLSVDEERERVHRRTVAGPCRFVFTFKAPAEFEIVQQSVVHQAFDLQLPVAGNTAMPPGMIPPGVPGTVPPGTFPPGVFPPGVAPQPGMPGMMNPAMMGKTVMPLPSTGPTLKTYSDWYVNALSDRALNTIIQSDLQVRQQESGFDIQKTIQSREFWLLHKLPPGNWTASLSVTLPSGRELQTQSQPVMLGLGLLPEDPKLPDIRMESPPPIPSASHTYTVTVQRTENEATWQINNGRAQLLELPNEQPLRLGLWLAGAIRLQLAPLVLEFDQPEVIPVPIASAEVEADVETLELTRRWSAAEGTSSVQATFVRLNGNQLILRRTDGLEIKVPLDKLVEADQQHARALAKAAKQRVDRAD